MCFQEGNASLSFNVTKTIILGGPRCGVNKKNKKMLCIMQWYLQLIPRPPVALIPFPTDLGGWWALTHVACWAWPLVSCFQLNRSQGAPNRAHPAGSVCALGTLLRCSTRSRHKSCCNPALTYKAQVQWNYFIGEEINLGENKCYQIFQSVPL